MLKGTPFHPRTAVCNQTPWWYAWDQYFVADVYTDPFVELRTIRQGAAVIDMSPLSKYRLTGPEALAMANRLVTRDASVLVPGQAFYTPWCNQNGKMVGDGLLWCTDPTTFLISSDPCRQWLTRLGEGLEVTIQDLSEALGILALQGPKSRQVLEAASGEDWSTLPFSHSRRSSINHVQVDVLRQGFSGEMGYELWVASEDALRLWDGLMAAGEPFGIRPAGEYAIDIARVEAGLIVISADYTGAGPDPHSAHIPVQPEYIASPFEMGLGHFVDFEKPDFMGRRALQEEQARGGPTHQLVGLELDWHQIANACMDWGRVPEIAPRVRWEALPVVADGHQIGRATSVTWSPTLQKLIGFGCVRQAYTAIDTDLTVMWTVEAHMLPVRGRVVALPFLQRRRATPSTPA